MRRKSLDMSYLVLCTILISLYLASFASSETTRFFPEVVSNLTSDEEVTPSPAVTSVVFELKGHLQMMCNYTKQPKAGQEIVWYKEGKELIDDNFGSRLEHKGELLSIAKATIDEAGNYTCRIVMGTQTLKEVHYSAEMKPILRMPANINVVEGEKLYIHCNVIGRPMPDIAWEIGNQTYNQSEDRVRLMNDSENGVDNAILIIEDIKLSDRNEYVCMAKAPSQDTYTTKVKTLVRVKDKLAALWPFLGICAEVIVLCAIILIYEKKRNKSELDESDTDQSPDQKNTPDHGKDSDVRQRK